MVPESKGWVLNQGMVGTTEPISWLSHVSEVGESTWIVRAAMWGALGAQCM